MHQERYPFRASEAKWQTRWEEAQSFTVSDEAIQSAENPYYVLEMFPYPSGNIHMGHVRNYTMGDALARYKRAQGHTVLHPMGWDAFGLPAENAAIERGVHPGGWTYENIATMREQLKLIGLSYDWNREFATCDPDYYQHEQRFFLKMVKAGLAYKKESTVNWDPVDHTVLANEQVIDGKGWRSGAPVERKKLSQWFLKITAYAEPLLEAITELEDWPEKVRTMQEHWIGRSYGASITFEIQGFDQGLEVYTTRPDTIYGMSFAAIAANHPIAEGLAKENKNLHAFIKECEQLGTSEEAIETAEKRGFDTGLKVVHPFTGEPKPLYVANFVLMDYGTGAIFGCPAHDQRDLDFARKYDLDVTPVVMPADGNKDEFTIENEAYSGDGIIINSPELDGLPIADAKEKAISLLEQKQIGTRQTNYRLRDWGVSRQRYWGCPIPMVKCPSCGDVPVPEDQLPVTLPEDVTFDQPGNPLNHHPTWKHVSCPKCGGDAERETDTFDTFFESSWYFARFITPKSDKGLEAAKADRWLPVNRYIGGVEHAVLHLLYARFYTRALNDLGYTSVKEPFEGLLTQGMVCHETYQDAHGAWLYPDEVHKNEQGIWVHDETSKPIEVGPSIKMSKSKRNTVDPRHIIESYGADTARLFILSDSPPERDLEWTQAGVDGAWRYMNRIWRLVVEPMEHIKSVAPAPLDRPASEASPLLRQLHKTIAQASEAYEGCHYNKVIALIREFTNALGNAPYQSEAEAAEYRCAIETVLKLMAPMVPHIAEECWEALGHEMMICEAPWPVASEALLVDDQVTLAIQVNGRLRATLELAKDTSKDETERQALALPNVQQHVAGKDIRKVIVVPGKIVNIVAA